MLSKPEIEFIRLLRCTESMVENALQHRMEPPYSPKVFQKYISALKLKLSQLEESAKQSSSHQGTGVPAGAAPPLPFPSVTGEALVDFRRRIELLARVLGSDEFRNAVASVSISLSSELSVEATPQSVQVALNAEARRQIGLDAPDNSNSNDDRDSMREMTSNFSASTSRPGPTNSDPLLTPKRLAPASSAALLDRHRHLQEEFTDEMLEFTSKLKQNALTTSRIVSDQIQSLEKLDSKLEHNSDAASIANQALKELFDSSSGSTWFHWSIMMLATLMFAGMYLFMKIFPKIPSES